MIGRICLATIFLALLPQFSAEAANSKRFSVEIPGDWEKEVVENGIVARLGNLFVCIFMSADDNYSEVTQKEANSITNSEFDIEMAKRLGFDALIGDSAVEGSRYQISMRGRAGVTMAVLEVKNLMIMNKEPLDGLFGWAVVVGKSGYRMFAMCRAPRIVYPAEVIQKMFRSITLK